MTRDLDFYLSVPWTVRREEHHDDGDYLALTIDELPGFVVASYSETELEGDFWDALEAFLKSYLDDGEPPPLPEGLAEALFQADAAIAEMQTSRVVPEGQSQGAGVSAGGTVPSVFDPARRSGRRPPVAV